MVCSCCGTKKRLFDIFYSVGDGAGEVKLCQDCWDVAEKLESDMAGREWELCELHLFQLKKRAKNPTETFLTWQTAHFPTTEEP